MQRVGPLVVVPVASSGRDLGLGAHKSPGTNTSDLGLGLKS